MEGAARLGLAAVWIGIGAGAVAAVATRLLVPTPVARGASSDEATAASLREVRDELAALSAKVDRLSPPGLRVAAPTSPPGEGPTAETAGPAAAAAQAAAEAATARLEDIATKAAKAVLAEQAAQAKSKEPPSKRRVPLAEAAREIGLTGGQEAEIRAAYDDANEKFLRLLAQPDSDVETVRRDLADAKGDEAKRMGLMGKYLPKILPKIGEMMAIQGERDARVKRALGPDLAPKYGAYDIEEEDPFGLKGNVSVTATDR